MSPVSRQLLLALATSALIQGCGGESSRSSSADVAVPASPAHPPQTGDETARPAPSLTPVHPPSAPVNLPPTVPASGATSIPSPSPAAALPVSSSRPVSSPAIATPASSTIIGSNDKSTGYSGKQTLADTFNFPASSSVPANLPKATSSKPAALIHLSDEDHATALQSNPLNLTQFVNVFIGTQVSPDSRFSGNLNPGAQAPFGMVNFGPDTPGSRKPWGHGSGGYDYPDTTIDFFSLTHLNGTGCRGQGAVAIIPGGETMEFSHADEYAEPGYYKVKTKNGITIELTATTRTGIAQITFPSSKNPTLTIDATKSNSYKGTDEGEDKSKNNSLAYIDVDLKNFAAYGRSVVGTFCGGTWKKPVFFYMKFDTPIEKSTIIGNLSAEILFSPTSQGKKYVVTVRTGISSVSVDNAKANLLAESNALSFSKIRKNLQDEWNRRLNAIQLDIARPEYANTLNKTAKDYVTQFYTALYRSLTGPTVYSDVNGEYRGMGQQSQAQTETIPARKIEKATHRIHYSGFSMWDTYRSLTQLQAMLFPAETSDMMQSLATDAQQCGAWPHWVDGSDDTKPMEGDHAPSVVAGAYAFGARAFDTNIARRFMLQSAFGKNGPSGTFEEGACNDMASVSRNVNNNTLPKFYIENGYIPHISDKDIAAHAGSLTLEMVTMDESIANFLSSLPNKEQDASNIQLLYKRAKNWNNIFNLKTKALQAKKSNGKWSVAPDNFHEATEPNYIWTITHDYTELIEKLGGTLAAIARLNNLFGLPGGNDSFSTIPDSGTLNSGESGRTFYIGNEPAFQTPWAYNWTGIPQLAQHIIPIIMRETFFNAPQGLPGNDDMGAMSAWYVWATLGLYPVIPSVPGLAMSTPQLGSATIWLADGTKHLRIEADGKALLDGKPFIQSVQLDGNVYPGSWLPFHKIANGGTLSYKLTNDHHSVWGTGPENTPPSGPAADYTRTTATH